MSWEPNYPWHPSQNGYGVKSYPTRVIHNQDILELDSSGQEKPIGHTLDYCQQLEGTCQQATEAAEKYYNMLVEHGIITPPRSQEDVNAELLRTIQQLSEKIERLEENKHGFNADSDGSREDVLTAVSRPSKRKNEAVPAD